MVSRPQMNSYEVMRPDQLPDQQSTAPGSSHTRTACTGATHQHHDPGYGSPDPFRLGGSVSDPVDNNTININNDMPDSFQLGPPISTHANNPSATSAPKKPHQQLFVSNGFDASAFYGLDDEDGEGEDEVEVGIGGTEEPKDKYSNPIPDPSGWGDDNAQEKPAALEREPPRREEPRPTSTPPSTAARQSPTQPVSGNQLLALFGAMPTGPNPVPADQPQPQQHHHHHQWPEKEDSTSPTGVRFCLPPCSSQSSSDESEP
mmetsp:Transcript_60782/g.91737  ORF Transcript_60782/g.91737 Transcript_60782/m.91737 type:complete len:260 (-) Transcript_60782:1352-2131(-)